MPDNFFNRNLPRIPQGSSNGFYGLAPLIGIALFEMIAFVCKLVSQTRGDVADPACFEWWLIAAKPGLISASTDRTNRNVRLGLSIVRCAIQLEQKRKIMSEDDDLAMSGLSNQALGHGLLCM